jgi:hypothetical protein
MKVNVRPWMYANLILRTPLGEAACEQRLAERADRLRLAPFGLLPMRGRDAFVQFHESGFTVVYKDEQNERLLGAVSARAKFRRARQGSEIAVQIGQDRRLLWLNVGAIVFWLGHGAVILGFLLFTGSARPVAQLVPTFVISSIVVPLIVHLASKAVDERAGPQLLSFVLDTLEATPVEGWILGEPPIGSDEATSTLST